MGIKYVDLLEQWYVYYGYKVWFFENYFDAVNKLNEVKKEYGYN